jgi:hypothetical protein
MEREKGKMPAQAGLLRGMAMVCLCLRGNYPTIYLKKRTNFFIQPVAAAFFCMQFLDKRAGLHLYETRF